MPVFFSGVTPLITFSFSVYSSVYRFWFASPVVLSCRKLYCEQLGPINQSSSTVIDGRNQSKTQIPHLSAIKLSIQLGPWLFIQVIVMLLLGFGSCVYTIILECFDPSFELPPANICVLILDGVVNSFYFFLLIIFNMHWKDLTNSFNEEIRMEHYITEGNVIKICKL